MTDTSKAAQTVVLVVEDDWIVRMVASDALVDEGFDVCEARHAAEAIDILERDNQAIHVLFTDVTMPGEIDGVGLAHHASTHWPWIGLLVASAKARHEHPPLPERARFLDKPYKLEHVVQHIRQLRAA